jgi:hypothetical protein
MDPTNLLKKASAQDLAKSALKRSTGHGNLP